MVIRGGSRAAATSKMERFVIIVNGFQPLTIITKRSILDVAAALDPPLVMVLHNLGYICLLTNDLLSLKKVICNSTLIMLKFLKSTLFKLGYLEKLVLSLLFDISVNRLLS